jgi:hypothetical protein
MPITTRLQTKYVVRMIIISLVAIVLGAWGILDAISIPQRARLYERGEVYRTVKGALEIAIQQPGSDEASQKVQAAAEAVAGAFAKLRELGIDSESLPPEERAKKFTEALKARNELQWLGELLLMRGALEEASRLKPLESPSPDYQSVYEKLKGRVDETGDITKPAAYDVYIKGLVFIPCLPFGFLMLGWLLWVRRRVYRLDEDGTLHLPRSLGSWPADEIADIDMSRWMAKSVATVVHTDGRRVKLDDYVHRDVHLIVGAIASGKYPDQWDEQAKAQPEEDAEIEAEEGETAPEGAGDVDGPAGDEAGGEEK